MDLTSFNDLGEFCQRRHLQVVSSPRWHTAFRASVHLKGLLNTFPPGPPMVSIDNQLQQLVGPRTQDVTMAVIRLMCLFSVMNRLCVL